MLGNNFEQEETERTEIGNWLSVCSVISCFKNLNMKKKKKLYKGTDQNGIKSVFA